MKVFIVFVCLSGLTLGCLYEAIVFKNGESPMIDHRFLDQMKSLDSMDARSRMKFLSKVDEQRNEMLTSLLTQLGTSRSKNVQAAAIYLIGRERLAGGVGELLRRIDLDMGDQISLDREPLWERYPAMEALITIGLPSVQPAIELLAIDTDDLRRSLATKVIRYVEGPEVAKFVLDRAYVNENDPKRKANLKDAVARLDRLVRETTEQLQ